MANRPVVGKYLPPSQPQPPPKERKVSNAPKDAEPSRAQPPPGSLGICRSEASFQLVSKLGEGTYGVVCTQIAYELSLTQTDAMKELATDEIVAVKKIRLEKEKEGIPITALRGPTRNICTVSRLVQRYRSSSPSRIPILYPCRRSS